MNIPYKYYKYIITAPVLFIMILTGIIYLNAPESEPEKDPYTAWTIKVNGYQEVHLSWNNQMFCGDWRVPIREHLTDNYCILHNGMELQPVSWTTGPDSLIYEEFMDAVVDTMRAMAEQRGYVSSYEKRW